MGLLNTSNYYLGGTLPAQAVKIRIYEEDSDNKFNGLKNGANSANLMDGLAAQQVQAQVQKAVRPVYEIGSTKYYIIDGRPQGSGQIAYLFGPSGEIVNKIKQFSDVCKPCSLDVRCNGEDECVNGSTKNKGHKEGVRFKSGTLTSFSVQATAQDFMVTGSVGFIFMDIVDLAL